MKMVQRRYKVSFATPAFIGNAEQSGQWRTPPFKALLRQWWRVVYAANREFRVCVREMRHTEGKLFGNAWLHHQEHGRKVADFSRSLVRIRLDTWAEGRQRDWQALVKVRHPEVKVRVGSDVYLGYGPISLPKGGGDPQLKKAGAAAIKAGAAATLSIAAPGDDIGDIEEAVRLMNAFGALGGRSRNGWGSLTLTPHDDTPALEPDLSKFVRDWTEALALDWPHAVGRDDRGVLAWRTVATDSRTPGWRALMRDLAEIKIGMRTMFKFTSGRNARAPEERHWLSYPVTNHNVSRWRDGRLPNSLRFKIRPTDGDPGLLQGVIVHLPCLPPSKFEPDSNVIKKVWKQVHAFLDADRRLERTPA